MQLNCDEHVEKHLTITPHAMAISATDAMIAVKSAPAEIGFMYLTGLRSIDPARNAGTLEPETPRLTSRRGTARGPAGPLHFARVHSSSATSEHNRNQAVLQPLAVPLVLLAAVYCRHQDHG